MESNETKVFVSPRALVSALRAAESATPAQKAEACQAFAQMAKAAFNSRGEKGSPWKWGDKYSAWGGAVCLAHAQNDPRLFVSTNRRPRATVDLLGGWVYFTPREEGEVLHAQAREEARAKEARYLQDLEEAAHVVAESGIQEVPVSERAINPEWTYHYGQMGGYLLHLDGRCVSAPGAWRRARQVGIRDHEAELIEADFDRKHYSASW